MVERPRPDDIETATEVRLQSEVLGRDLARRVRIDWPKRRVLVHRFAAARAVDLRRGDEHHPRRHVQAARGFQQRKRPEDVHAHRFLRALPTPCHVGERSEVVDHLRPCRLELYGQLVGARRITEIDPFADEGDLVATGAKMCRQIAADEARGSGDKGAHT